MALYSVTLALTAAAIGVVSYVFRFNDPGGTFAGLTDDHFFYVVRGWQILYGDLPVRDFVDHGAPLFYYVAAAVQAIGGRGTLSEVVFTTAALSAGAALACIAAARASGSVILGAFAGAALVLLEPRLYNYPKILVYAAAIPVIWGMVNSPSRGRVLAAAFVTAVGFLFRHDHGVFVAIAAATALLLRDGDRWRTRMLRVLAYSSLVVMLLAPYLMFLQWHGGAVSYFRQAMTWAERDRERAPLRWPDAFAQPEARAAGPGVIDSAAAVIRANNVAWIFYVEIALPIVALAVLAVSANAARRRWRYGVAKIGSVAVLGLALNAGFLRSPLEARLADPSVPHVILLAWLCASALRMLWSGADVRPAAARYRPAIAAATLLAVFALTAVGGIAATRDFGARLQKASMTEGTGEALLRMDVVRARLENSWPLDRWAGPTDPGAVKLAFYLRSCTAPTDRVFVQDYLPQVIALAERAYAAGHADLRWGFFDTEEAELVAIERLRQQSVPIVALAAGQWYEGLRQSYPRVAAYLNQRYRLVGDRALDERFAVTVLVERGRAPVRHYAPLDAPCFR